MTHEYCHKLHLSRTQSRSRSLPLLPASDLTHQELRHRLGQPSDARGGPGDGAAQDHVVHEGDQDGGQVRGEEREGAVDHVGLDEALVKMHSQFLS